MYLYVLLEVTGEDRVVMDVDVVVVGNGQVVTEDQMCNALERLSRPLAVSARRRPSVVVVRNVNIHIMLISDELYQPPTVYLADIERRYESLIHGNSRTMDLRCCEP